MRSIRYAKWSAQLHEYFRWNHVCECVSGALSMEFLAKFLERSLYCGRCGWSLKHMSYLRIH